ncbi:hypothetical protein EVAR_16524_1 [Eumeta japonica]|uniref:Uncharacterized protein n=1 Tax=Eumeta variegata TaxID=151549 RepID=A0A4C1U2W2_EUMVA|nr:hypothetical protein EVAR_16524_1 [Eumeta japonica]
MHAATLLIKAIASCRGRLRLSEFPGSRGRRVGVTRAGWDAARDNRINVHNVLLAVLLASPRSAEASATSKEPISDASNSVPLIENKTFIRYATNEQTPTRVSCICARPQQAAVERDTSDESFKRCFQAECLLEKRRRETAPSKFPRRGVRALCSDTLSDGTNAACEYARIARPLSAFRVGDSLE